MVKKGLGNGLNALFTEKPVLDTQVTLEKVQLLPIGQVSPNPNQPRQLFDDEKLAELVKSVREQGILQPILVRPTEADRYQIIAGERRYRAATDAGLKEVPCIIRDLDDNTTLEVALIENIQRQNLNPLEEARTYKELMEQYGYTQAKLAEKLGKSRVYVANTIRLLSLPPAIRESVLGGQLSAGHGRALLQLGKEKDRLALAERIVTEGLSVRQAEAFAKDPAAIYRKQAAAKPASGKPRRSKPQSVDDLLLHEVGERLRSKLGTKVNVQKISDKQGRIVLEYYSLDDLDRLLTILLPGEEF